MSARSGFNRFTWLLLGYTLLVIVWGAFVRATGSGAGCGSHWPLCNGQILPRSQNLDTVIEFTHRLSSGLLGVMVAILVLWTRRLYPRRHVLRRVAISIALLVVAEALIGAGIVRFEWVASNVSVARLLTMAFHLLNTFFLVAAIATLCWAVGKDWVGALPRPDAHSLLSMGAVLLVGMSGAVIALGDTLVIGEGMRVEDSALLARIVAARWTHPGVALAAFVVAGYALRRQYLGWLPAVDSAALAAAKWAMGLFVAQLALGAVNVGLRAPVVVQLAHLLLSDLVWIFLVMSALGYSAARLAPRRGDFEPGGERFA